MLAIGDEMELYLLIFTNYHGLQASIARLQAKSGATRVVPGITAPIASITEELKAYFAGSLKDFKTPVNLLGSTFQKLAWRELQQVPYGQTKSYVEQATAIGRAAAYRAVANANGANQLMIVVPCHRIVRHNGALGGYGGGIPCKRWLIDHERRNCF